MFTYRTVYSCNKEDEFLSKLDERIVSYDKEIERICSAHYQGFTESVNELLKVSTDANKLKTVISETNEVMQTAGIEIREQQNKLIQMCQLQTNLSAGLNALKECLPVLEVYIKLRKQLEEKQHYPALKTLELLEDTYLNRTPDYTFCSSIRANIPTLRESIKDDTKSDLNVFLEGIHRNSVLIGNTAFSHVRKQRDVLSAAVKVTMLNDAENADNGDEEVSAHNMVNFSPVYNGFHIYLVLECESEFREYYRGERNKQLLTVLDAQGKTRLETSEQCLRYFKEIIGFFVIEDHVMSTTQDLVTKANHTSTWNLAVERMRKILKQTFTSCTEAGLILHIEEMVVLLCDTLSGYGYNVAQLYDELLELQICYDRLLCQTWSSKFRARLDNERYAPIDIQRPENSLSAVAATPGSSAADAGDLQIIRNFPFFEQGTRAKTAFSPSVPLIYHDIKEYSYAALKYMDDLNLSTTEKDAAVRRATLQLLQNCLSPIIKSSLHNQRFGLAELMQIAVNLQYFDKCCPLLEEYISNLTGTSKEHESRIEGTVAFQDVKPELDGAVISTLENTLQQFLDCAEYDWVKTVRGDKASAYVTDMLFFLETSFLSFNQDVPVMMREIVYLAVFTFMAKLLTNIFLDPKTKAMSLEAIGQFNLDVIQCENFAAKCQSWLNCSPQEASGRTVESDGIQLQERFAELRQMLNLLIDQNFNYFISKRGMPGNKYDRIIPKKCLMVLEKLKENDDRSKKLFSKDKRSKESKKYLETVIKQLRDMI